MADLSELRAIPAARARLDAAELALIDQARRDGATWADVAEALGLASRQAAEQRRLRLATTALRSPAGLDEAYGERIAALRAAAVDLHRRIGADRRWDRRFTRAALVRETLAAAHDAPAGSLFALVAAVVDDLGAVSSGGPSRNFPQRRAGAGARLADLDPSARDVRDGADGTAVGVSRPGGRSPAPSPSPSPPPPSSSSFPSSSSPSSSAADPAGPAVSPGRRIRPALPGPTRAAVDRLRAALAAAAPHT